MNASAVPTFLPKGDKVRIVTLGTTYTSCTACEEDDDAPPSDGGPGGGGGGPGGSGPGGPGGGGPGGGGAGEPSDGESEFVKLVVCSEHAGLYAGPDLYSSPPDEERFVRLYGYCFRVPTGPTVGEIPEGAQYVYTGGSYDNPQPPQQRVLAAGEHTLSISATTNDPLYHVGAWYRFDLTFSDLPEAP